MRGRDMPPRSLWSVSREMLPVQLFPCLLLLLASPAASKLLNLGSGEVCGVSDGVSWKCSDESVCTQTTPPSSLGSLDVCSTQNQKRVLCCPPPWVYRNRTKAEKMCELYAEHVFIRRIFPAGKTDACLIPPLPLVVGGQDARIAEFPHMVLLGYGERDKRGLVTTWGCGGSLISERFILSAAHCRYLPVSKSEVRWANVGDLQVRTTADLAPNQILEIVERYVPGEYHPDRKYHDIALFKLERDVRLSPYIRPACLNVRPDLEGPYIATGWGQTGNEIQERSSSTLKKVNLAHVENAECTKSYKGFRELPEGINGSLVCAGGIKGKDTCRGDSGGPLQVRLREPYCMYALVGLTSFGQEQCAGSVPSVYTRVSAYLPWIEGIVWPQ